MSEKEVTYYVFGLMDEESQGGFVEVWSGTYDSCVDYIAAPQAQLDIQMGVFASFVIWDEEDLETLEGIMGYEGQTIH